MKTVAPHVEPSDVLAAFRAHLEAQGLLPGEIVADGRLRRCPKADKPRSRNGAYVLHLDEPASGWWQNHRAGKSGTWTAKAEKSLAAAEKRIIKARIEADRKRRQEEETGRHVQAAETAHRVMTRCSAATSGNGYLARKGVRAVPGLLQTHDGKLVVPVLDAQGKPQSLQVIGADGSKRFLTGGKLGGGFFSVGPKGGNGPLYIAEGLATGLSIFEATEANVLVSFDCGNLGKVAKLARERYPERPIVMVADNDLETDGNPGLAKATAAAKAVGGLVAIPTLAADPGRKCDMNDLHQGEGLDAVRACLGRPGSRGGSRPRPMLRRGKSLRSACPYSRRCPRMCSLTSAEASSWRRPKRSTSLWKSRPVRSWPWSPPA